ncbi:DUF3303 domain-containing protein [Nocardia sp. NPDC051750]|uniref:DUF3303 domain-containing protein n=1 Tax=Nocardia sp. NPDC051750 TaxID=3364325 RepID=UPI0037A60218
MKYVVSWKYRWNGSAAENEESVRRALAVFANWKPVDGVTYHQMVGRLDGSGGFAVVETDNPIDLTDAPKKFGFFADYEIQPVVELAEAVQAIEEGVSFRESIS